MQKSIKKNFIMNAILTMSSMIFPLITFPYVSRILLPLGTGKVAFATSVVTYFSMFSQLGIPTYGIRACAQVRDDKEELSRTVQELFLINFFIMIIAYIALFIAIQNVPRLRSDKTLFLVISTLIFFNAIGMEWLFKALEEYTYITVRSIIFKIISVGAMFLLVRKQEDYVIYGAISIFASSASNVFNFFYARRYVSLKLKSRYNFRRHLQPVMIFFAMSCATTIYTNLDTAMLGFMKSDEDVGYYNAATKIKTILVNIITSLGIVLLPRASYYVEQGLKDDFEKISRKAINCVCVASIPMVIYFTIFSKEAVYFLSGTAYDGSVLSMQLLMPTILFIGLTNVMGIQIMVPLNREKWVLYSVILGAVVDLIINVLLIPSMASAGAAIGTMLAEAAVLIYQYAKMKKLMNNLFEDIHWSPVICGTVIATIAVIGIKIVTMRIFVKLIISASIFFGIYGLILIAMKEPIVTEVKEQFFSKIKSSNMGTR